MSGRIGQPEPRRDRVKLVTGRATFTDDFSVRGLLHGFILTSRHPHARVVRVNAARARAMPGVAAVLTHDDGHQPPSEATPLLRPLVRYAGDRVALIAAEDPDLARRAADAVDVHYDPLPAVFDLPSDADTGTPVALEIAATIGNANAAFPQAEHVLERTYRIPRVAQCATEPQVVFAWLDEDQRLVVRTSNHAPFNVRQVLAQRLGLPVRRIRVVTFRDSGGFGGRIGVELEDLCAVLALKTGRPVRLAYDREQELIGARAGHAQTVTVRSGVVKGQLTALDVDIQVNAGASDDEAAAASLRAAGSALSIYRCANVRFRGRAFATNLPPAGALRGDGLWQAAFALESHIDEIAMRLREDPLSFRSRHHVREQDSLPLLTALGTAPAEAPVLRSCGLDDALRAGARAIGWSGTQPSPALAAGVARRGLGVAIALQTSGAVGAQMTSATVDMLEDGSFHLFVGTADVGAGTETVLCQIAAEELDAPLDAIVPHPADTDSVPFASGATRASALYGSGLAVAAAARQVRDQLVSRAAKMLAVPAEDLVLRDGAAHAGHRRVGFDEIGRATLLGPDPRPISGTASHALEDTPPPPFAAVFAEVEVAADTGVVRVLRLVEAVDCGRVLNPQIAEVRITAGALQGMGYALTEAVQFDTYGHPLTRSLRDYRLVTAADVPDLKVILVPTEEPSGPFGAKSIAEVPIHAVAPAIANAIANATGARVTDLPLGPERVLAGLEAVPQ